MPLNPPAKYDGIHTARVIQSTVSLDDIQGDDGSIHAARLP